MTTFGAIGGAGWLGAALLRAALEAEVLAPEQVWISSRSSQPAGFEAWPGLHLTRDNAVLARACDRVLLSVRPQDVPALDLDLSGKLILSVMAMVDMETIRERFGTDRIIRAMPNAAAEQRLSFTPLLFSSACSASDRAFARDFFHASGETVEVSSEEELAYFTGLTGSGPAFFAAFADAMIRDAERQGIKPEVAECAVRQLLRGGLSLLAERPESPARMVETFLAYEGTTAAGIVAMRESGLQRVVESALTAAQQRALGKA